MEKKIWEYEIKDCVGEKFTVLFSSLKKAKVYAESKDCIVKRSGAKTKNLYWLEDVDGELLGSICQRIIN